MNVNYAAHAIWLACCTMACSSSVEAPKATRTETGFSPQKDGFGFQNYGNDAVSGNLTAAEMRRAVGATACQSPTSDSCTLTPVFEELMTGVNEAMNGGHCDGMAALSGLFFQGALKPVDFGADLTSQLTLAGNEKLQREIAYFFLTQLLDPTSAKRVSSQSLGPVALAAELERMFEKGRAAEMGTLVILKRDLTGGHAITPYAVVRGGDAPYDTKILVYDNNFPREERAVEITSAIGTWRYMAAADPRIAPDWYDGDLTSGNLGFVANSVRLQPQVCTICEVDAPATGMIPGGHKVFVNGQAHALNTDASGAKLGYDGEKFVDTMSDGSGFPIAGTLAAEYSDPVYELATSEFDVQLEARASGGPVSVANFGRGTALSVRGLLLAAGQRDRLKFSGDGRMMEYTPMSARSPRLLAALQYAGADWKIVIEGPQAAQQSISVGTDAQTGKVRVQARGASSVLQVTLTRAGRLRQRSVQTSRCTACRRRHIVH